MMWGSGKRIWWMKVIRVKSLHIEMKTMQVIFETPMSQNLNINQFIEFKKFKVENNLRNTNKYIV